MITRKGIVLGLVVSGLGLVVPTFHSSASNLKVTERGSHDLAVQTRREFIRSRASIRLAHAKELLGRKYQGSVVKAGQRVHKLDILITEWVRQSLRTPWKPRAHEISKVIIQESDKYKFDPVFLLAVIGNESSFNPVAIGTSGEIGLMQILPQTAEWICKKNNLVWKGPESLKDPITNIRLGAAYLSYLRGRFNSQSQLYLAAYNMGSTNVRRALERQTIPQIYSSRVMQRYIGFYGKLQDTSKRDL